LSESPLATLSRILAGVVLMQGRLGHQVLGQLLVTNSNEVAIAAASLVVAATTNQRSAVGQMALRTVAPALAVRVLLNKQEERLERKAERIKEREQALDERRIVLDAEHCDLQLEMDRLLIARRRLKKAPPRRRRRIGKKR
jgi:hypothetical protein